MLDRRAVFFSQAASRVLWLEEDQRTLVVARVERSILEMLAMLPKHGDQLPDEAGEAIVTELADRGVPVRLPANLMGEEVPPRLDPLVVIARPQPRSIDVEVHFRPLASGLSFPAGQGPELCASFGNVLARLREVRKIEPRVPKQLKAKLRPYQQEGFAWLTRLGAWGAGACLADDMGLGKTLQALALLLDRKSLGPALVVAPTSVCFNWEAEAKKFAPGLSVRSHHRADRATALQKLGKGDVLVASYGLVMRDAERFRSVRFATLVIDEAKAIKNSSALRSRAVRDLDAEFRVALTGTPLENHLGELWSIFRCIVPGLLGSEEQFRTRFSLPGRRKALGRMLAPFLLRRTKGEVARDLPPKTEVRVPVTLSAAERGLYEQVR